MLALLLVDARKGQAAPRRLAAEEEVARDAHHRDHAEILEHGRNAQRLRVARVAEGDRLAVDEDLTRARPVDAGQHLDQRRLAGAVVAEQAMHLAGIDLDVDVLQRPDRTERDADAAQFHGWRDGHDLRPPPSALVRM